MLIGEILIRDITGAEVACQHQNTTGMLRQLVQLRAALRDLEMALQCLRQRYYDKGKKSGSLLASRLRDVDASMGAYSAKCTEPSDIPSRGCS